MADPDTSIASGSADADHPKLEEQVIPAEIVAVLLAAGSGSRFAGPTHKLLARLGSGSSVIASSIANVLAAGFAHVVVVTGAVSLPDPLMQDPRIVVEHNPEWSLGQARSLRVGIGAARRLGAAAVVIGLGDQPFIDPEAWRRVALCDSTIAVAVYGGRRGHPVRLARTLWESLPAQGDVGARDLIDMRPDEVSQVDCPGSARDIDTQEDLDQWT